MSIRVALIDDQTLVRQGIRGLLELSDRVTVVAEADDGDQALRVVTEARPDVLLMDMRMPRMDGAQATAALAAAGEGSTASSSSSASTATAPPTPFGAPASEPAFPSPSSPDRHPRRFP